MTLENKLCDLRLFSLLLSVASSNAITVNVANIHVYVKFYIFRVLAFQACVVGDHWFCEFFTYEFSNVKLTNIKFELLKKSNIPKYAILATI